MAETAMVEAWARAATSASLKSSFERLKTPNKDIHDSSNCFLERQPRIQIRSFHSAKRLYNWK